MQITGITQAAIQQVILSQLTPKLIGMYAGGQIGGPSAAELEKIATSVATSAAKGTFDKIVAPVKADVETIITACNAYVAAFLKIKQAVESLGPSLNLDLPTLSM